MKDKEPVKDVVCGMLVDSAGFATEYQGSHFAFCSPQCRERFLANPHLYVGLPGRPAPKQRGETVLKRRRFALDAALDADQADTVSAQVGALMGIKTVEVCGDEVVVTYDLLQTTAVQVEAAFEEAGARLGGGWAERLRRGFVHYTEECEIGHLQVDRPSGCH
ncbi:YHS domain-containing protein [Aromatoleum evansii]|uniref:YHS domain-containing protein n=1 Tax=Aromatoleum evansii TaxID=59406 RepID=UPI00145CCE64|nr:YHS domain-containing protein [Aromatoleum evansii]